MKVKLLDNRVDADGNIFNIEGVDFEEFRLNPVVLGYDRTTVIGKVVSIKRERKEIHAEFDLSGAEHLRQISKLDLGGIINKTHMESQRIWYKPWTWRRKPVRVIDEFKVIEASLGAESELVQLPWSITFGGAM